MNQNYHVAAKRWIVVCGLLLAISFSSAAYTPKYLLSTTEKEWLTYLREEEKLARDVYLYLYDLWGATLFNNISLSEQRHMDAIKFLLDKYQILDPAAEMEQGEFTNPEIQALYDELIEQGSLSFEDALNVGILIELADIADLQAALDITSRKDIRNVYTNLHQGSQNHLTAFQVTLAAQ